MTISLPGIGDIEERIRQIGAGLDATGDYIRNALLHFSGVREAEVAASPREVVWSRDKARLFRYESTQRRHATPVLLVMSLVTKPTIFDLTPRHSLVRSLLDDGHDVFMLDWGVPDAVDAGNTLETYSDDYLPRAIERCVQVSGNSDVSVLGYCLGGVLTMLTAAARPELPIASMVLLATPVNFHELGPGIRMLARGRVSVDDLLDVTGNVAPDTLVAGFTLVQPAMDIATYNSLWHSFFDERSLVRPPGHRRQPI
ncbi:alpha/beta fold hydrolase [Gordonia sp. CPCC 205515]|uniref:alpha/beta fold hydrolase n=1 Tax=Gordonia sp. CPCC 205515 TaxID=3140791 RepID=UPI003AF4062F